MKKLFVFLVFACIFAAVDLYLINLSAYLAAGLAAAILMEGKLNGQNTRSSKATRSSGDK